MVPIDISFFFATERKEAFTNAAISRRISAAGIPWRKRRMERMTGKGWSRKGKNMELRRSGKRRR
jgi:hypothetical protein